MRITGSKYGRYGRFLFLAFVLCGSLVVPCTARAAAAKDTHSPHEIRTWSDLSGWHLRWRTEERMVVIAGDLILRGAGAIESVRPVGADSTAIRLQFGPRRVIFRARAGSAMQGLDISGRGEALSCQLTVNGLEDNAAVYLSRDGTRHPPGFPFLVNAAVSGAWMQELANVPPGGELSVEPSRELEPEVTFSGDGATVADVVLDAAWSLMPVSPPAGAVALWLDETGWHMTWADTLALTGIIWVQNGMVQVGGGSTAVDTLRLEEKRSPLEFRTTQPWLELESPPGHHPMQWMVGASGKIVAADRLRIGAPGRP